MDKEQLNNLLLEYVNHTIKKEDYIILMDLVCHTKHDSELYVFMNQVWDRQSMTQSFTDFQSEVLYKRITTDQRFTNDNTIVLPIVRKETSVYKLWKVASAAIILITAAVSLYFYFNNTPISVKDELSHHHIPPGGNKAILTLSSGEQIVLTNADNGKLAEQAGVSITKAADGQLVYSVSNTGQASNSENTSLANQYNIIETPIGGQYQVRLPDGTQVWLNAASSLKFPAYFSPKGKRQVALTGEAYFEVAHNKKQPFVVNTARQAVTVLGTHFNINTYTDEPFVKTTLLAGSVSITANTHTVMLRPGQESLLNSKNQVVVNTADLESAIAWKNGKFIYNNEDLHSIMRKLSRWYNVEIVYKGDFTGRAFDGSVSRFNTVAEVLRKFELTNNLHFKIEGRRITVMP